MMSMLRCCTNRITSFVQSKIVCRKYMTISEKMETLLKKKDRMLPDYKLMYRERNPLFLTYTYHSLTIMSYITVGTLGYRWYNDIPIQDDAEHFTLTQKPLEAVGLFFGVTSIFYVSFLLRSRVVLRIYFSPKSQVYRAVFIGRLPFTCEHCEFPVKSLEFASKDSALPWRSSVLKANNRKMYLFEDNFRTYSDFLQMLKPEEIPNSAIYICARDKINWNASGVE